jgi:HNH endonuclease
MEQRELSLPRGMARTFDYAHGLHVWLLRRVKPKGQCWEWTSTRNKKGYGKTSVRLPGGLETMAYRAVWRALYGPIPDGMTLDHLCRNRACVNPAHLELVTHRENVLRGEGPCAKHARATHCKHGHPLVQMAKQRGCPTCDRISKAASYQRNKTRRTA